MITYYPSGSILVNGEKCSKDDIEREIIYHGILHDDAHIDIKNVQWEHMKNIFREHLSGRVEHLEVYYDSPHSVIEASEYARVLSVYKIPEDEMQKLLPKMKCGKVFYYNLLGTMDVEWDFGEHVKEFIYTGIRSMGHVERIVYTCKDKAMGQDISK